MEGRTAYRQPMTVFWSPAQHQHHVTATNFGINSRLCRRILFQYLNYQPNERFQGKGKGKGKLGKGRGAERGKTGERKNWENGREMRPGVGEGV